MVNGEAHTARDYIQAQKVRGRMMGHMAQAFRDCDMLLTPTAAITAPKIRQGCVKLIYPMISLGTFKQDCL